MTNFCVGERGRYYGGVQRRRAAAAGGRLRTTGGGDCCGDVGRRLDDRDPAGGMI
jgi:hypothetical protein